MRIRRVLIVRHGQTEYNLAGRWQGHLDVPLNSEGSEQVTRLGHYLKDQSIDAIYSSDLERAWNTATAIARHHGLQVQVEQRLREVHLGLFQGLSSRDLEQLYPSELHHWRHDDHYVLPNGESRMILQQRAYEAWRDHVLLGTAHTTVLVSHGGTIRMLMRRLFPDDLRVQSAHYGNTSLTILNQISDQWVVEKLNYTPHLE